MTKSFLLMYLLGISLHVMLAVMAGLYVNNMMVPDFRRYMFALAFSSISAIYLVCRISFG